MIMMTGPPGAGKTTTGRVLAGQIGAALLDLDSMTNPLVDVIGRLAGASAYDDPRLAALARDARYGGLVQVAGDCVEAGVAVVMVAPFTTEREDAQAWNRLEGVLSQRGGRVVLVWQRISRTALGARLVARGAVRDQAKIRDLEGYLDSISCEPPRVPFLEVDAEAGSEEQASAIMSALIDVGKRQAPGG